MPAVAFNVANCLERLGRVEDAVDAYHWFASAPETAKNPSRVEEAQKRLEALKARLDN